MTSRQEVYEVDISLARLAVGTRAEAAATEKLLALAADAEQRRFIPWALEARLAALQLMVTKGTGTPEALRKEIEKTARQDGFARILRLLQEPAS